MIRFAIGECDQHMSTGIFLDVIYSQVFYSKQPWKNYSLGGFLQILLDSYFICPLLSLPAKCLDAPDKQKMQLQKRSNLI